MKQLTIRGVDPMLEAKLKSEAKKRGQSLNRTVVSLLTEKVGLSSDPKRFESVYHDLDELAGTWSEEEARTFEKNLGNLRQIDQELWE